MVEEIIRTRRGNGRRNWVFPSAIRVRGEFGGRSIYRPHFRYDHTQIAAPAHHSGEAIGQTLIAASHGPRFCHFEQVGGGL